MHATPVQRKILSTRRIMVPPLTLCAYMKKGPNLRWSLIQCSGGDEGDRTPDLLTASQALSQLSYAPVTRRYYRGTRTAMQGQFRKNFLRRGRGCGTDSRAGARGARPAGLSPRMRPIYYVWAASPDHGVSGINKTAGRRPAVFAKYGVWSRGRG